MDWHAQRGKPNIEQVYEMHYWKMKKIPDLQIFIYRPFNKTLPRSSAFVNCTSVRFYETVDT